ncbi:putative ankyrin repeat-containing domain, PGG domain, ankyrin repeat-containing domain superfamily [Helianthus annuus]|nr:putative ankyrin repeat-containing domain, PGG domain, ankyrin repeat-containing domain superfamily [Helianthus annuus]
MQMASSSNAPDVSRGVEGDLTYIQALNANVSNFVSVKLSSQSNYPIWKAQMLCLVDSQMLRGIIDYQFPLSGDKQYYQYHYDNLVKGWIFGSVNEKVLENLVDLRSAQEVWMKLKSIYDPPQSSTTGVASPGIIFRTDLVRVPETEDTSNIRLKKDLYKAADEGCWWKAKSILKNHKNATTEVINGNGDTILHVAVERGHNYFIENLLEFLKDEKAMKMENFKGQTALHIAAMVGNTYAAQLLVQKTQELLTIIDRNKERPFDTAFINLKHDVSTYLIKSGRSFEAYYLENAPFAIFSAIQTKEYDLATELLDKHPLFALGPNISFDIILLTTTLTFPTKLGFKESLIYPSFDNVRRKIAVRSSLLFHSNFLNKCVDDILRVGKICNNTCCSWLGNISMILIVPLATLYPIYELICLLILVFRLPFSMLYFHLWTVLAVNVRPVKNIEKKKKAYDEAKKFLSEICNRMGRSHPGYWKPIIEAVRRDTYEVVDEILFMSPDTINCKNEEGHDIIQLAIINRSEKVYKLIYHIIERTESCRKVTDSSMNSLAHLVGRLAPSSVLGRTTGAALQMQRELLWREEVQKLMSPLELIQDNIYKETPAMVFTREHQDLMTQGECWMKTTAESCSITAALIVTIVFAAAITVPGGNQESGIPVFKKETAFTIFAVSNAFSLFTATTALLLFLSILTTRFSEKDFLVSLPRRLILGLFTLFLSTIAMIVAFGAILFLVFCDHRPWMLAPIAGFACLPISVIVTIKLPLLVDLIQSTYISIFGKQSYLESCKINRKTTILA